MAELSTRSGATPVVIRLGVLVMLLLGAVGLRRSLQRTYDAAHPRHEGASTLLSGALLEPTAIQGLDLVQPDGSTVRYQRDPRGWKVPRAHGAYALSDRVEGMLGSILGSVALSVHAPASPDALFGLPTTDPVLRLVDGNEQVLLELEAGRRLPGWPGRHGSFARISGSSTIHHLSGVPISFLGAPGEAPHPMLDTRVLPAAVRPGGQLNRIRFEPEGSHGFSAIGRQPAPRRANPFARGAEEPRYLYTATTPDGDITLDERAAGAYFALLAGLSFVEVLDPASVPPTARSRAARRVVMEFDTEGGSAASVWIEVRDDGRASLVACSATEQLTRVAAADLGRLYPEVEGLRAAEGSGAHPGTPPGLPSGMNLPPDVLRQLQRGAQPK